MDVLIVDDAQGALQSWGRAFAEVDPEVRARAPGEACSTVIAAIVHGRPNGHLSNLPQLRLVFSATAGVDQILEDESLPHAPLVRMVPKEAIQQMREYVCYHAIRWSRRFDRHIVAQHRREWPTDDVEGNDTSRRACVLGLGCLGMPAALALRELGYDVTGWSRSKRNVPGLRCLSGRASLAKAAEEAEILVCLLPLTPETRGILDAEIFDALPPGACVISVGRGECLHERDLLAGLKRGQPAQAVLDVFECEPLPRSSSLWLHPQVVVTPHIAADPTVRARAQYVSACLRAHLQHEPIPNIVDRARGY